MDLTNKYWNIFFNISGGGVAKTGMWENTSPTAPGDNPETNPPPAFLPNPYGSMQHAYTPGTPVEPPPALCTRGMTRKGQAKTAGLEIQDGAAAFSVKGTPHGTDKMKDLGPKTSKLTKPQDKDAPKDMIYYAQNMKNVM